MSKMPTRITDPTTKLLADRLLLGPRLAEYGRSLLLVTTGGWGQNCSVRLSIVAPEMEPATLAEIRRDLVDRLRAALKPITMGDQNLEATIDEEDMVVQAPADHENPWIYKITIEPHFNSGEPQVVVAINDPQYLGFRSAGAVLSIVRGLLTPVAKEHYRELVILEAYQRLVPLDFQVDDSFRRSMTIELPAKLELRQFHRKGDEYDEDALRRKALALRYTLEVVLGLDDKFQSVDMHITRGAVGFTIFFETRKEGLPSAADINRIQQEVCHVVAKHVRCEGFCHKLVIVPAREEHDPEGDYDEDAGWLGEHTREY